MKKTLMFAVLVLVAAPAFAKYIVVLRDGTRYTAKAKWTIVNGKALVLLENGQSLQLDPSLIDVASSEQMTKIGMASANVIDLNTNAAPQAQQQPAQPSLGDTIKLRTPAQRQQQQPAPAPAGTSAPPPITGSGTMPDRVLENFHRAFDNVGVFERKITSTSGTSIRAEITVDTEDRVFNAISATALLVTKNAFLENVRIDMVELFMRTTTGGSAGRFQMSRADAEAVSNRTISHQDYFVRKVIY